MITKRTVIGTHAFFARAGAAFTSPSAGTVSKTAKPDSDDNAWIDFGTTDWEITRDRQEEEFYKPAPGKRQLDDIIVTRDGLTLKGTLMELNNLAWEMLLATAELPDSPTAGGQYNPLEGVQLQGWLKIQQYNQANTLINTMDVYIDVKVDGGVKFGDKPVDMNVTARVLWSSLNTGTLT